ncbi:hypothetical protein SODALDRAFT_356668 [Sodiomyces alkalinus F11]|uniref:Uncharacterized protein n=1 Tax=Sodiomyces alkalinus (strain CBS 110278 / VKM F-3762 / F11) TaxID=1314773 RepID=A0A3N2Q1S2_SODAK|nr:hypothetical protein SODALDRAFT_356668 [Sodiomyces alkalinus F11]ROT40656.1 hypothetical protein SODALDRAFT_356668 [Sodiomyces alkalinus F11]
MRHIERDCFQQNVVPADIGYDFHFSSSSRPTESQGSTYHAPNESPKYDRQHSKAKVSPSGSTPYQCRDLVVHVSLKPKPYGESRGGPTAAQTGAKRIRLFPPDTRPAAAVQIHQSNGNFKLASSHDSLLKPRVPSRWSSWVYEDIVVIPTGVHHPSDPAPHAGEERAFPRRLYWEGLGPSTLTATNDTAAEWPLRESCCGVVVGQMEMETAPGIESFRALGAKHGSDSDGDTQGHLKTKGRDKTCSSLSPDIGPSEWLDAATGTSSDIPDTLCMADWTVTSSGSPSVFRLPSPGPSLRFPNHCEYYRESSSSSTTIAFTAQTLPAATLEYRPHSRLPQGNCIHTTCGRKEYNIVPPTLLATPSNHQPLSYPTLDGTPTPQPNAQPLIPFAKAPLHPITGRSSEA